MRAVIWQDESGYLHRSFLPDDADPHLAHQGIPADPPDLSELDMEEIRKELHNGLVRAGLWEYKDLNANRLTSVVRSVVQKRVSNLYRRNKDGF